MDLNHRPSGYEPDELPNCSTPPHIAPVPKKHSATAPERDCRAVSILGEDAIRHCPDIKRERLAEAYIKMTDFEAGLQGLSRTHAKYTALTQHNA